MDVDSNVLHSSLVIYVGNQQQMAALGDPEETLGSKLWNSAAPTIMAIWKANQYMEDFSQSLPKSMPFA